MHSRNHSVRFSISSKQLILVGIPLAFELILIAGLFGVLHQEESARKQAALSSEATTAISKAKLDLAMVLRVADKSGMADSGVDEKIHQLLAQVKNDLAVAAHRGPIKEQTDVILVALNRFSRAFDRDYPCSDNGTAAMKRRYYDYENAYHEYGSACASFNTSIPTEGPERTAKRLIYQSLLRKRNKLLLKLGLAVSVLLSLSLAIFFSRNIRRRIRLIADNSKRVLASQTLNPVDKGSDEIACLDRTFHEVASALTAAREKDRATEQLRDQIVSMITHDLRTPLQTVLVTLECIEQDRLPDPAQSLYDSALVQMEGMGTLINNLLDLNQLEMTGLSLAAGDIHLNDVITTALEAVIDSASRKNIAISITGDASIHADERRIRQLFIGLFGYAIKHGPANESIQVAIGHTYSLATVKLICSGQDISRELLGAIDAARDQVKTPDVTADSISMALCKALVDLHNGVLSVVAESESHNAFCLDFPLTVGIATRSVGP